jgi:hypothetical protein
MFKVISRVLHDNNFPFVSTKSVVHVCDACQQGKSHQVHFLSVPYRLGTPTYKLQVKTGGRVCIHAPPRVLQHQTRPPCLGGLQRCRMSRSSGPGLLAQEGSSAKCIPRLWTSPRLKNKLRCCHVSYGFGAHRPVQNGCSAGTCPMALCGP